MFTSGSTGGPKGVVVTHDNVTNLFLAMNARVPIGSDSVFLAATTFAFDMSVLELLWPLSRGARVVVMGSGNDGEAPGAMLKRHCVTHFQCTPSLASSIVRFLAEEGGAVDLQHWFVGGEALSGALAQDLLAHSAGGNVSNFYGPTETTVFSTEQLVSADVLKPPIGRPLANTQVYVLGDGLELRPTGCGGELYIGGAGVATGYIGQPATTAARFIPDPYGPVSGARLYRTGDLVSLDGKGVLHSLGRTDDQVKVRGHRVELGEVESRLVEHHGVESCAVLARDGGLAAFCRLASDRSTTPAELAAHLRECVPEYMVPNRFVFLESVPKTPNGKTDRKQLAALHLEAARSAAHRAPAGAVEEGLAALWSALRALLGAGEIGVDDDFFELGGHSLLAVQLASAIRDRLGVEVPLRSLFEHRTIAALAAAIEVAKAGDDDRRLEGVVQAGVHDRDRLLRRRKGVELASARLRKP